MDFIYSLGGIAPTDETIQVHFRNAAGELDFSSAALRVHDRVRLDETVFAEAFGYLQQQVAAGQTPKLTIPSPSMVHYRGGRAAIDPDVYPEMDAFWDDLTAAYAEQVRRLGELGCTYLQLDDTSLAYLNDPAQRAAQQALGSDAEHQHELYIRNINKAIAGRPESLSVTTHMCRGNFRSSWAAEGGYDFVAEALFGQLDVDGFFLEYDDERSGGFAPLRYVPEGKQVVLGLVTTKSGALEDKDTLKRRIDEASAYVPLEQLCLSPAVRLLLHRGGQHAHPRGAGGQAAPGRGDRRRGLGLSRPRTQRSVRVPRETTLGPRTFHWVPSERCRPRQRRRLGGSGR